MSRELDLLSGGEIEIVGRLAGSSNATFAVVVSTADDEWFAIYKPVYGERPLWDFEPGLHRRERAAYLLSEELGWGLVPPTVIREDGPAGEGSLQWFIDGVETEHYFTLIQRPPATHDTLRKLALFDYVINNTDRKSGHVIADADDRVWGIDHGLCFGVASLLRTVIWDFAGQRVPDAWLDELAPLADGVPASVRELINGREARAVRQRVRWLLDDPTFPRDESGGYGYPWPLI